ncbi:MAG: FHA domain-containing protein [Planctomycetota bacterium]
MAELRVIVGADEGKTAHVQDAPVTIGRADDCGLQMTDEHVSHIHAVVEPFEQGYRVRDLESTEGTAVNGKKVIDYQLVYGDIIKVGVSLILFGSGDTAVTSDTVSSAETPLPGGSDTSEQS